MHESLEVIVAGGGVAGLAAALAFRKAGHVVTVVERAATFGPVGAGILLQANGLMVLDALGLGEETRARGTAMPSFLLRDRHGRCLVATELQAHLPEQYWPVCIHRAHLNDILWRACVREHVTAHFGSEVITVEEKALSPVLVCNTPHGARRISGNLIVGADGVHSAVREAAGIATHLWPIIEGSVQGVLPVSVPAACHGEYIGASEACGMLPMGKDPPSGSGADPAGPWRRSEHESSPVGNLRFAGTFPQCVWFFHDMTVGLKWCVCSIAAFVAILGPLATSY